MDTVRLRDDPFEDDDPLEEDAQHRSETAGSILEMYKKRAKEVTHSLQQAMVQEHIPAIRSFTAVADELLTTTLDDGSNVVRGDVRSSLSQKKRKGMEALKVFHEYSELELKDWRYRRQALRLQHVTNTFDNDQKAVICTMFNALHKHRQFRGLASQYGPVCDAPAAWESVDRILRNDALAVKRDRVAFLHLAMFFLLHQNQEAELSPLYRFAADWVFALQAMGAFLFSIYFEEDVAAGRAICIESGLPVDLRRDDEQFLLYFYFEPSGQARVTLLNDVRNWSGALQLRDLEPPIRIPGFCRQRCFHVEQDLYDPSDVQVQGAAFLSFTILDFAKEFHWQRQQLGSLISKTDEEMAEYWLAGHNGASSAGLLPNSEASRKWIVRLANRRQRALLGRWNLGLRHTEVAYASSRKHVRMTNDRSIDAVQELWGSKGSEGIMPISLEPPNDAMDWALEGFLQQCLQDGKDDLGLEEEGIAVLAVCTEEELLVEVAQQRPELAWLLDPTLRQEQERRAEEIRSHWNRLGVEGPSRRWLKRKQETAAPALEAPGKGPSAKDEVQSMLEVLSQKRMKFRRVLRGVRLLQRLELLSSEKLRVLTHGSHMVFHGPGGAATLVREHKGPRLSRKRSRLGLGPERGTECSPQAVPDDEFAQFCRANFRASQEERVVYEEVVEEPVRQVIETKGEPEGERPAESQEKKRADPRPPLPRRKRAKHDQDRKTLQEPRGPQPPPFAPPPLLLRATAKMASAPPPMPPPTTKVPKASEPPGREARPRTVFAREEEEVAQEDEKMVSPRNAPNGKESWKAPSPPRTAPSPPREPPPFPGPPGPPPGPPPRRVTAQVVLLPKEQRTDDTNGDRTNGDRAPPPEPAEPPSRRPPPKQPPRPPPPKQPPRAEGKGKGKSKEGKRKKPTWDSRNRRYKDESPDPAPTNGAATSESGQTGGARAAEPAEAPRVRAEATGDDWGDWSWKDQSWWESSWKRSRR
ncbi:unnamed protein product [Durusdinium trenchii]|uniref:Uncharacterized protein n=1 Tax=Durusdinium trenchii TaxID=1381693 RepID=A0ABP0P876_9DINO